MDISVIHDLIEKYHLTHMNLRGLMDLTEDELIERFNTLTGLKEDTEPLGPPVNIDFTDLEGRTWDRVFPFFAPLLFDQPRRVDSNCMWARYDGVGDNDMVYRNETIPGYGYVNPASDLETSLLYYLTYILPCRTTIKGHRILLEKILVPDEDIAKLGIPDYLRIAGEKDIDYLSDVYYSMYMLHESDVMAPVLNITIHYTDGAVKTKIYGDDADYASSLDGSFERAVPIPGTDEAARLATAESWVSLPHKMSVSDILSHFTLSSDLVVSDNAMSATIGSTDLIELPSPRPAPYGIGPCIEVLDAISEEDLEYLKTTMHMLDIGICAYMVNGGVLKFSCYMKPDMGNGNTGYVNFSVLGQNVGGKIPTVHFDLDNFTAKIELTNA